jgi:hypothetical protein
MPFGDVGFSFYEHFISMPCRQFANAPGAGQNPTPFDLRCFRSELACLGQVICPPWPGDIAPCRHIVEQRETSGIAHMKSDAEPFPYRSLRMIFLISLSLVVGWAQKPSTGAITGWVRGIDGKPLAGVTVLINARPDMVHALSAFNAAVVTVSDGSFTIKGVPDGTYSLCPHPPNSKVVAPCSWIVEPRATVTNGQTVLAQPIQFQAAVDFYVRVNDPKGTRAAAEGRVPGAGMMLAVRAPNGRSFPIPLTARDAAGFDHHLAVPAGANLVFTAMSNAFSLADNVGQLISKTAGLATPVAVPTGQTQVKQVINVR